MKVVEVVPGLRTGDAAVAALSALAERMGHRPVAAADTPGFLVNHAGRGYSPEALRAYDEGVADHVAIDRILRDGIGFRMGPFELIDLDRARRRPSGDGADLRQFYHEPRFRPVPHTRRRMAAGLLGRKSGEGYYRYADGRRVDPPRPSPGRRDLGQVLVGDCEDEEARAALVARLEAAGVALVANPEDADLFLVMPFGSDCTAAALELRLPPRTDAGRRSVPRARRRADAGAPGGGHVESGHRGGAGRGAGRGRSGSGRCEGDGAPGAVIGDSPGFVAQRVLANVVNVACDIALRGIADPADIDVAVRLGLGYPKGAARDRRHDRPAPGAAAARMALRHDRRAALPGQPVAAPARPSGAALAG
jgi:3-hydroxybutyryl-CoA dehydrogenase